MAKQNKLKEIKQLLETAQASIQNAKQLLQEAVGSKALESQEVTEKAKDVGAVHEEGDEKIVEGVFDGQNMIGPDGKQYSIPANYASKSKLVEGDVLKLTITSDGSFVYKQIGPVERNRLVGALTKDETSDEYRVLVGDKIFKVLLASITYFKGESGDEVVILVPRDKQSGWAAVENIIRKSEAGKSQDQSEEAKGSATDFQQPKLNEKDAIDELGQ